MERTLSHRLNPFLYTIEVTHGPKNWVVRRRYHHFRKLHTSLYMFQKVDQLKHLTNAADSSPETTEKVKLFYTWRIHNIKIWPTFHYLLFLKPQTHDVTSDEEECTDEELEEKDDKTKHLRRSKLPKFPVRPDSLLNQNELDGRKETLEKYLQKLLKNQQYRNHHAVVSIFFLISLYLPI